MTSLCLCNKLSSDCSEWMIYPVPWLWLKNHSNSLEYCRRKRREKKSVRLFHSHMHIEKYLLFNGFTGKQIFACASAYVWFGVRIFTLVLCSRGVDLILGAFYAAFTSHTHLFRRVSVQVYYAETFKCLLFKLLFDLNAILIIIILSA